MKFRRGDNLIIKDRKSVFIDGSVKIGNNVTIYENNRIEGSTVIGDNAVIYPNCRIIDSEIQSNSIVIMSDINGVFIGNNCKIGPFARIRPNTLIKDGCSIGNFVEIKNSEIGEGTKINHLAYVGDAKIGKKCNVGCGVIFANYDGRKKEKCVVGDGCFIGSNCNLVAPVNIGDGVYVCAGTTVTDDCNDGDFVIGRVRQISKSNKPSKYLRGE